MENSRILVIDDDPRVRSSLQVILRKQGYLAQESDSAEKGLATLKSAELLPQVILLDLRMKEGFDGFTFLERAKKDPLLAHIPIVVISGYGDVETVVKATKLGAFDFIEKPLSLDRVYSTIRNALTLKELTAENEDLREKVFKNYEIIGSSSAIVDLREKIGIIAQKESWVLILGENGTGKELVARNIFHSSKRFRKPFVEVNCAAIPEELIESELFGHEKGAFTGATEQKKGKFDQSNEGTIFLDEIGDMSLNAQAKILRILEEKKFERVGGSKTILVDVRVLAATNKDLEKEMKEGRFREDLFYRLNVIPIKVPPLRERGDDILILADHFLEKFCASNGEKLKNLSDEAKIILSHYPWPGNVRELKNLIEQLVIMTRDDTIAAKHLPDRIKGKGRFEEPPNGRLFHLSTLKEAKNSFEMDYIRKKLEEFGGNISKTAEAIGVERSNLHKKIRFYGKKF